MFLSGHLVDGDVVMSWSDLVVGDTLGCPPSQDARHHQEYYIFSRESQPKPSFPLLLGGDNPSDTLCVCVCVFVCICLED